ncbi:MAG TPA: MmcQ/YjbR family DNA-binding protein [Vitreimonas sp.]|uniref:MmcQ/YjbR family DNA-binding protein n=1 Tax=Vitreimonas sp. TaxID=3069702 RepID=UPI002D45C00F|nr:MmcQ/YjbR family DNA-binding protein [Vitreimonas sp.]HYD88609.1 MmcQ/YjbR family DNA-binding protein [Vitreimonas sp.]
MAVSKAKVRKLALALEGASEVTHVDRPAFRTTRKIFATLPPDEEAVNLMFDPPTQEFFCEQAPGVIAPLPGGWGRMGMSRCDLKAADEATVLSALKAAHALAAPKVKAKRARKKSS